MTSFFLALGVLFLAVGQPVVAETEVGAVEGHVRLGGKGLPSPTRVRNTTDPARCGGVQSLEDFLVSSENRGIQNVLLALTGVPRARAPKRPAGTLLLDNQKCRFVPHVGVLSVGDTLVVTNSDPFLHTVHLYGVLEANRALPFRGSRAVFRMDRPGFIAVRCDLHGWMQAFLRVDDHPFHAVSSARGVFRIEAVPAGTYDLEAWHERLGVQKRKVRIEAGKTQRVEIEYPWSPKLWEEVQP